MKILLVEDDEMISKATRYLLMQHDYEVDIAKTIQEAREKINNNYVLVILDVMLPDGSGLDFLKEYNFIPMLVLSAVALEDDVVKAIDMGAFDYIIKPFRSKELLSRINSIIKRTKMIKKIEYENLVIDLESARVFSFSKEVSLTSLEIKILFMLLENKNKIMTREVIINKIWDMSGKFVNDNTLTVYIKRIREKLQNESFIKTIKGIGYRVDI